MTSVFSDGLCFEALQEEITITNTRNYSFYWIKLKRNGTFVIQSGISISLECGDKVWPLGTLTTPSGTSATTGLFRITTSRGEYSNIMLNASGDICSITKRGSGSIYSQCDSTTKWSINCNYLFSSLALCNASDVVFPFMESQLIGTGIFVNSPYLSFGPDSYNTSKFFNNMYENNYNLKTIKDEKYCFCNSQHSCFAKCRSMMSAPVLDFSYGSAGSVSNLLFDCNNIRGLVFHGATNVPSYSWNIGSCFAELPIRRVVAGFDKTIHTTPIINTNHSLQYFKTAESVNSVSIREKGGYYAKSDAGKGFREKTEHATDPTARDNSYFIRKESNDFCQEWIEY